MGADNELQLQETVCENGKGGACRKRTAKRWIVGAGRPKVSNCLFLTRRALGNSENRSKNPNDLHLLCCIKKGKYNAVF